ncbi:MAG: hypothetical protein AAFR38_11880 [Planctomycetota bacterium]
MDGRAFGGIIAGVLIFFALLGWRFFQKSDMSGELRNDMLTLMEENFDNWDQVGYDCYHMFLGYHDTCYEEAFDIGTMGRRGRIGRIASGGESGSRGPSVDVYAYIDDVFTRMSREAHDKGNEELGEQLWEFRDYLLATY